MMGSVGRMWHTWSTLRRGALAAAPAVVAFGFVAVGAACGARSQLYALGDTSANDGDGGGDARSVCVHEVPSREPAPAYIELVLDGSGSMLDDGKWEAAKLALGGLFDEYLAHADPSVSLGLLVFSGTKDPSGGDGPYPTAVDVTPAFVDAKQFAALNARIANMYPIGPTPTFPALTGGYAVLRSYVPEPRLRAPGRRVLVLVSDGAPTAASAAGEVDVEKAKTVLLVGDQLALSPSLSTFAIGIGPFPPQSWADYDPAFMGDVAVAGGTRTSPQCVPHADILQDLCHIQITPSKDKTPQQLAADMLAALHDVRARTVNLCAFELTGDFSSFDPARTKVTLASGGVTTVLPQDPSNGWQYDANDKPRSIVLRGSACEAVLDDASAKVTMAFGCG